MPEAWKHLLETERPPEFASFGMTGENGRAAKVALLAIFTVGLSMAHYATSLNVPIAHDIMDRLYYVPIALAAFWFGRKGSIAVGLAATLFYIPHIIQWELGHSAAHPAYGNKYVEAVMYPLFGFFVGYLVDIIRARNAALSDAYHKLLDSYEAAQRSAKLAAVGQVAAGLAHEIRNPLAGLQGAAEAMGDQISPDNTIGREFLNRSLDEIRRINSLVSDFVAFGKPSPIERAPVQLAGLVRGVAALLSPQAEKNGVHIELRGGEDSPELMLDANKIKQAVLNLMLNGIQAMSGGGVLRVAIERGNDDASIIVRDQGRGIPEGERASIFDPFFSTKEHGAGLGLPLARQIAESHGGTLMLGPPEGPGTTFIMRLPVESRKEVKK